MYEWLCTAIRVLLTAVPATLSYFPHPLSSNLDGYTLRQNWSATLYKLYTTATTKAATATTIKATTATTTKAVMNKSHTTHRPRSKTGTKTDPTI